MSEATLDSEELERLRSNVRKVLLLSGMWMFLLLMPVIVPFFQARGLDMQEVFALQTIFALTMVVCEVPSGYVSDVLGRKRCLLLSGVCYAAAYTWLLVCDGYWDLVVFEVLGAVAVALRSGTDTALLYDSLEALGEDGSGAQLLGRRLFWMQMGETIAALLAVGLVAWGSVEWVAWANCASAWVPLLVCLSLVEPPRQRLSGSTGENLRRVREAVLRGPELLRPVLACLIAYGAATLLVVWAFQDYWIALGIPVAAFGVLWAAYNGVVAVSARVAHRVHTRLGSAPLLGVIAAFPVLGYGGLALCAPWGEAPVHWGWALGGVAFGFCFQGGRGLTAVVLGDALNRRVSTEVRATVNSISSLGVRLSFAGFGPLLGWLMDARGHAVAFGSFAGLYGILGVVLTLPLAWRLRRRKRAMMTEPTIRRAREGDRAGVRAVELAAFEGSGEADLVERLVGQPGVASWVACEDGRVVGHLLLSPVTIDGAEGALGLGPMAVAPERQRQGVGGALIEAALAAAQAEGVGAVVVLGHPEYYPRFGFEPAAGRGVRCKWEVPPEAFMVRELTSGWLAERGGAVEYDAAFDAVEEES